MATLACLNCADIAGRQLMSPFTVTKVRVERKSSCLDLNRREDRNEPSKEGMQDRTILRLMNECGGRPHYTYRFNEKDADFLRRMAEHEGDSMVNRADEKRSFCRVLHQELKRVKEDADVDSLFLDKKFLSKVVEDLDSCYDAPIIEEVKERAETKKRMRMDRATRPKRKYHKKTDST